MGSFKSATGVKSNQVQTSLNKSKQEKFKMSQPQTTYRRVPTGSVNLRVPKLIGSKWVYEYPVGSKPQSDPAPNQPREIPVDSRNYQQETPIERRNYSDLTGYPREIPVEAPKPAPPVREDWRGPWPTDNLGPKPRLIGGKLVKPKLMPGYH